MIYGMAWTLKELTVLCDDTDRETRDVLFVPLFGFAVKNNSNDRKHVSHHPCYRDRIPEYQN